MELCAVVPSDPKMLGHLVPAQELFTPAMPTPLHLAVWVRLNVNYGRSAKLTSELAAEFAALGWCTPADYIRVTADLIGSGLAEGVELRVNPLLHTSDGCQRCTENEQAYAEVLGGHTNAVQRWEAGIDYPYATSTATLHIRDCTYAPGKPAAPEPTLHEFTHSNDGEWRLVIADDNMKVTWEDLDYGGSWWNSPYGPPPGNVRRGGSSQPFCLSIREARTWTMTSSARAGRPWKPCRVCRPIDPCLLDTADTTVLYRAEQSPSPTIVVEAVDGQTTTMVTRLTPPTGSAFAWGRASEVERAATAIAILIDAASATAPETPALPHTEFIRAFLTLPNDTALRISRTDVRAWLREWYRKHPTHPAPTALAVLLDHDLALRPDPQRLSTLS